MARRAPEARRETCLEIRRVADGSRARRGGERTRVDVLEDVDGPRYLDWGHDYYDDDDDDAVAGRRAARRPRRRLLRPAAADVGQDDPDDAALSSPLRFETRTETRGPAPDRGERRLSWRASARTCQERLPSFPNSLPSAWCDPQVLRVTAEDPHCGYTNVHVKCSQGALNTASWATAIYGGVQGRQAPEVCYGPG